jgi:hypothetical protein
MDLLDNGTLALSRICFVFASEAYPPYPPLNCYLGSFGVSFLGRSPVCKLETQPEFLQEKKIIGRIQGSHNGPSRMTLGYIQGLSLLQE